MERTKTESRIRKEQIYQRVVHEYNATIVKIPTTKRTTLVHYLSVKHAISESQIWKLLKNSRP